MSRIPLLIGAVVMLGAGSALAQDAPGAPPPPPGGPGGGPMHPMMERWLEMHRHDMAMMQKAAAFRFRRGDAEIDIKCAADEPTNSCVDAASALIDKVMASTPH